MNKLASFDIFVDQMKKKAAPAAPPSPAIARHRRRTPAGRQHRVLSQAGGASHRHRLYRRRDLAEVDCEDCANNGDAACSTDPCKHGAATVTWRRGRQELCPHRSPPQQQPPPSPFRRLQPSLHHAAGDEWDVLHVYDDVALLPPAVRQLQAFTLGDDGMYDFGSATRAADRCTAPAVSSSTSLT